MPNAKEGLLINYHLWGVPHFVCLAYSLFAQEAASKYEFMSWYVRILQ